MSIESPYSGKPKTTELAKPGGKIALEVKPKELTPIRALIIEFISRLCAIIYLIGGIVYLFNLRNPDFGAGVAVFGGTLVIYKGLPFILKEAFAKEATILFSSEHLKIKTLFGWKTFDRQIPHKFTLIPHDKTPKPHELQEMQAEKHSKAKKPLDIRLYYNKSFHIIFEYMGQRIDIIEVFEHKPASAILARLKLCDEIMNNQLKGSNGTALKPQDQWHHQPGEITG